MSAGYALIGGGAGQLGTAVADRLLRAGRKVVVLDLAGPALPGVEFHETDLADETATGERVRLLLDRLGAPEVLVLCQGWSPKGPDGEPVAEAEVSAALFRQVIDVNLTSCFLLTRTIVPAMAAAGRGRVVLVGSTAADTGRTTAGAAYAAAKAGLAALTRLFAVRYGRDGVLVNTVAPGKIANPGWAGSGASTAAYVADIPLGRLADKDEVAEVVTFLVSDRNTYLTGQTVIVDGGRLA
ncbi:3-ketoacyl-ACP reductase [Catellatospora methionotrophica]|uniref:3-ketoacyl-ACP reductase n=1 Tax=Catellatospora methionotrophica TaxID=121620 RepID=A0A8J3LDP7_9ACTN|nr:SDR family oxidoreductase [Catellatospora methionotrophica]GIG16694.1 3-ketoacyl-ACP reductase [Catellatospora methionotrophica]